MLLTEHTLDWISHMHTVESAVLNSFVHHPSSLLMTTLQTLEKTRE